MSDLDSACNLKDVDDLQISRSNLGAFPSRASAILSTIFPGLLYITTDGYDYPGDGGRAQYKRVALEPSHAGKFQSADLSWWELDERIWRPEMVGGSVQDAVDGIYTVYGSGTVHLGSKVWELSSRLYMWPNIEVTADNGGELKRADGASIGPLVDFHTNLAHKASLRLVIANGNRGTAALNSSSYLVNIGAADDVTIDLCLLMETIGSGVIVRNGKRPRVTNNTISRCAAIGIAVVPNPIGRYATRGKFNDNTFTKIGQHPISFYYSDGNKIKDNVIDGDLKTGIICNIDPVTQTATRTSGGDFTDIEPGQFLIFNGNTQELHISEVISSNVVKFDTVMTFPAVTNAITGAGTGDLINLKSCSNNFIHGNIMTRGAGCGVVLWDDDVWAGLGNKVTNNIARGIGSAGYSTQGRSKTINSLFHDNLAYNCGLHGAAGHPDFNCGYTVQVGDKTRLSCNTTMCDTGSMTHDIIIRLGTLAGSVYANDNNATGVTNPGIKNAIKSLTLGPQWGSTATVSDLVSNGSIIRFTVTPGGSGITIAPLFTIVPVVVGATAPLTAVVTMQIVPGTTGVGYVIAASATSIMANLPFFTPTAGVPVQITVQI